MKQSRRDQEALRQVSVAKQNQVKELTQEMEKL